MNIFVDANAKFYAFHTDTGVVRIGKIPENFKETTSRNCEEYAILKVIQYCRYYKIKNYTIYTDNKGIVTAIEMKYKKLNALYELKKLRNRIEANKTKEEYISYFINHLLCSRDMTYVKCILKNLDNTGSKIRWISRKKNAYADMLCSSLAYFIESKKQREMLQEYLLKLSTHTGLPVLSIREIVKNALSSNPIDYIIWKRNFVRPSIKHKRYLTTRPI